MLVPLGIGTTLLSFQSLGSLPSLRERLKREAMDQGEATSANDLSIQADTESGSEAECGLIFFKSMATSAGMISR